MQVQCHPVLYILLTLLGLGVSGFRGMADTKTPFARRNAASQMRPLKSAQMKSTSSKLAVSKTRSVPHLVGWHDECDDPQRWQPLGAGLKADSFITHKGAITVRLPRVPDKYPYTYQWGGLKRDITVDIGRYPVLVGRVSALQDGSYAHLQVQELDYAQRPTRTGRATTVLKPGLSVFDVGKEWGITGVRSLTLNLIVGGALYGASGEYASVRFVRREDVPFLQVHPDWQNIILKP